MRKPLVEMHAHARVSQSPDGQACTLSAELQQNGNVQRPELQCDLGGGVSQPSAPSPGVLVWREDAPEEPSWRDGWQTVQTCIREEKITFRASGAKKIITHPNERINKLYRGIRSSGEQLITRMQSLRFDSYTKTCQPALAL